MREVSAKIRIVSFFSAYIEEIETLDGSILMCEKCGKEMTMGVRIVTYSSSRGLGTDLMCRDCYDGLDIILR